MTLHWLDDIAWHSLVGPQARHAAGQGGARRYAPGYSPIVGFADSTRPDFDALRACCVPGEAFYCIGLSGPPPAGWSIVAETQILQMLWLGAAPPADAAIDTALAASAEDSVAPAIDHGLVLRRLAPDHLEQVLALVALTRPGPFGPRTIELGDYVGVFAGPRLVAMAGERMQAGPFHEISGVCTHPDHQGRGLAGRLMRGLVARHSRRGATSFLHVMGENRSAQRTYLRLGFTLHQTRTVRVMSFDGSGCD